MNHEIDSQQYLDRRSRLMEQHPDGVIYVSGSGGDGLNPNFRYLTGLDEPRGALILAHGGTRVETGRSYPGADYVRGRSARQLLFLPPSDPMAARWGESSPVNLQSFSLKGSGVDAVYSSTSIEAMLGQVLTEARSLFYIGSGSPVLQGGGGIDTALVARIRNCFLNLRIEDVTGSLHEMRRLKSAEEAAIVSDALTIVQEAFEKVWRIIKPGMYEYEIEAEITRVYRSRGAQHAFEPIVACGANALSLHYTENSGTIQAGELLLIDSGAAIGGYCSDISRTFPVDGRFTDRQREIYDTVLAAEQAVISQSKPGALLGDLHAVAYNEIDKAGFGEQFVHGVGHYLGMETHDVGDLYRPFEPGVLFTVEPGIYQTQDRIGVRIEDDVLITAEGCSVLSSEIPSSADVLEQRIQNR
jgi:Xaa-Pro aminopeptidase